MTNNIFKIKNQSQLDKIIKKHSDTLIIIAYCSPTCKLSRQVGDPFIKLSENYPKYYFIFANVYSCETENEYYIIESTPHFIIYFKESPISQVIGFHMNLLENNINLLSNFLTNSTTNIINNDDNNIKIKYLKLLYDLTKKGIILSKNYNLKSDLDDMIWEYNIHTQPDIIVNSQYKPIIEQNINMESYNINMESQNIKHESQNIKHETRNTKKKQLIPDENFMNTLKSLITDEEKYKIIKDKIKQKKIESSSSESESESKSSSSSENADIKSDYE